MALKSVSSVLLISLSLSACVLTGGDKEEAVAVSKTPKVTKASLKSEPAPAVKSSKTAKCDDKGFCPLPGLKVRKKAE